MLKFLTEMFRQAHQSLRGLWTASVGIKCIPKAKPRQGIISNANGDDIHTGEDSYFFHDGPNIFTFGE